MTDLDKRKPKGTCSTTELINYRFYENQKRQALTTAEGEEDAGVSEGLPDDIKTPTETGSIKQTCEICDTVESGSNLPHFSTVVGSSSIPDNTSELVSASSKTISALEAATSSGSDKSRKGSVDKRIWNLVNLINKERDSFFTTSSCSGRIILYTWEKTEHLSTEISKQKKGCKWLLVSHDEIKPEELVQTYTKTVKEVDDDSLENRVGVEDVYFKMEPCILHVQCRTLTSAKKLVHISTESGFRNSGMVIGKENRITVAIRSAMGLEVPLPVLPKCVSDEYLTHLTEAANAKMRENWNRSDKLTTLFSKTTWS